MQTVNNGDAAENMNSGLNSAIDKGKKAANAVKKTKKAVKGVKDTAKNVKGLLDLMRSGKLLKILLNKPSFWLGQLFGNLWWILIVITLCMPLAWLNMEEALEEGESEAESYEKMINEVMHVYHNAYTTYDQQATEYLNRYITRYFPDDGPAQIDDLDLDLPEEPTGSSNLTEGGVYYLNESDRINQENGINYDRVGRKVTNSGFPEAITAEEQIAIQYIAINGVIEQYYLGDDSLNLDDFSVLVDHFFGGLERNVAYDRLDEIWNSSVEYGSYDSEGNWINANIFGEDTHSGIINRMELIRNGDAHWTERVDYSNTAGDGTDYIGHTSGNVWEGEVEIMLRVKRSENFLKDKREDVIEQMMEEDDMTEEEATAELNEMFDDMVDTITSEVLELKNQGFDTNPDGSDPTPDDDPSNPDIDDTSADQVTPSGDKTLFIDYGTVTWGWGSSQYVNIRQQMSNAGILSGYDYPNIQCAGFARYCFYKATGIAPGPLGDGKDFAAGVYSTYPQLYRPGRNDLSDICSGAFISMRSNGYYGYSAPGHIVYVDEVGADGTLYIDEAWPYTNTFEDPGDILIREPRDVPFYLAQNITAVAIPTF